MEELDLDLVAALGLPSPVEGVTREMLGKVGWVSGLSGRAIKIAHRPKVYRTPAPKYPRHRIRATWAVRVCLEDSVDMSELENSKAKLEEGVVMTITIFNLPRGEEEPVPDSDREGDPPVGDKSASRSRSEDELRKEAISPEHLFSHRPKNPFCPVCQKAKMLAPRSRKVGTRTIESKAFGDHITCDHIILKDLTAFGFHDQKDAFVIKDVFTSFRYCYPSETKTADQCHEDFLHFLQVKDDVGIVTSIAITRRS